MMKPFRSTLAALLLAALAVVPLVAQGVGTGGITRLAEERRLAGNWRRVLMIGAHPDDENTELLTILARGEGIETAYLSFTRGEGGQNLIGNELGVALGVLRTEELLAARRFDGGHLFFGRAFDFGFSKSMAEAFEFWPHDSLVKDAVRIIRRFRPQVVIAVWSGTPADGHGHHQAAGVVALEAYRAAGDASRFPELQRDEGLAPYTVAKFYRSYYFTPPPGPLLVLDGGAVDPITGLSFHQISVRSRDQHRSQSQGNLEELGPSQVRLGLIEKAPGITGTDDSVFSGVPSEAPPAADPHRDAARLVEAGIVLDATTDDDEVVPGQLLPVTLSVWNSGRDTVRAMLGTTLGPGYSARGGDCPVAAVTVAPGALLRCVARVAVSSPGEFTEPYYLSAPRVDAMYHWVGNPAFWGEPFAPPSLVGAFRVELPGVSPIPATREVQGRFRDQILGELRRSVAIVPRVAVELSPDRLLWPRSSVRHPFRVTLEHLARDTTEVSVALVLPAGWRTGPSQLRRFVREGERATVDFVVTAPANLAPGEYQVRALVLRGSDTLRTGLQRIRYAHIGQQNVLTAPIATVVVADVKFPAIAAIGYVRGGGDRVPEALINSGLPVKLLTGDALERGALDAYKVIVIGARAYEADESLRRAHPRLMRWLTAGGTLVVQYQQGIYFSGRYQPRPFTLASPQDRVTDEHAAVTLLAPRSPLLTTPNRIGAHDFDGWIQERGLDFAHSWDAEWQPILEMHDAGDQPREGGLLVTRVGRGTAIYTGLSFVRQLPAAVPGAWRLFANLLDAGQRPAAP
ncbi:MAG: PIG-L family deacetylase [Gemmatimonadota bacterium]